MRSTSRIGLLGACLLSAACSVHAPNTAKLMLRHLGPGAHTSATATRALPSASLTPEAATSRASSAPASPAPSATPSASSGGGGTSPAAPAATPTPSDRLLLPDGSLVAVSAGASVPLPSGVSGPVSLFMPGWVPASINLPASGVTALHPLAASPTPAPTGMATVQGAVLPSQAGVTVLYFAKGRQAFAGTTTAPDGSFSFTVPMPTQGLEAGVLVARDGTADLALTRVTLVDGNTTTAPTMALIAGTPAVTTPPVPPSGQDLLEADLVDVENPGASPWQAPLLIDNSASPAAPAQYNLVNFTQAECYTAASADGLQGGSVSGAPGAVPAFLPPPDLSGLPATLTAGSTLDWPDVPGASLYTLRLTSTAQTAPVWEGASTASTLALPTGLALALPNLVLEVDAWDAPDVTIYSVAEVRALRVPSSSSDVTGRHCWSRRIYNAQPKAGP